MSSNECIGQGFIADGYFITAAHVVRDNPDCYIIADGHKIQLCNFKYCYGRKIIDAFYVGKGNSYREADETDVILYKWNNTDSPLHLNIHEPKMGEILKSHCKTSVFNNDTNTYISKYSIEDAMVLGEDEGNYFYCKCRRFSGSSGSPLLWENQVVGIMNGGDNKGLICAFLKISSFIFHTDIHVEYNKSEVLETLLPNGIDRTLQAMHTDLSLMGINMAEEGIHETGYYTVINRLPFDIHDLTDEERKVLDEYCTYIIEKM